MRGVFCVDPGGSTGLAWAILDDRAPYAITAVRERLNSGSMTITGDEHSQIRALYREWMRFKRECVQKNLLDPAWLDLVVEDFVLSPGEKPGKKTTMPERVAWGFEGYRMAKLDGWRRAWPTHYTSITWQKPGAAKRFSNQKILRDAEAWVVGREHERSAFAHMILRMNVLLDRAPLTRA